MAKAKKVKRTVDWYICKRCFGFGVLANTPGQEPMYQYRHLPAETKEHPNYEKLEGFHCPDCKGSGLRKEK